jgi:DNA-binding NarL/FixJ family response regulator
MKVVRVLIVDDQQLVRDGIASLLGIQPGIEVTGTAADGAEAVAKALETTPDVVLMDVRMPGTDGVEATLELRRLLPSCRVVMLTTFDDDESVTRALQAGASGYLLKDLGAADLAAAVRLTHAGVAPLAAGVAARLADATTGTPTRAAPGTAAGAAGKTAGARPGAAAGAATRATTGAATGATTGAATGAATGTRTGTAGSTAAAAGVAAATASGGPADRPAPGGALTAREVEILRLVATGATNREIGRMLFVSEGTVKNHVSRVLSRLGLRDRTQAAIYARDHGLLGS